MNTEALGKQAAANLKRHLKDNVYPGRGLILGCDVTGIPLLIYWIMGRSENSRNRIFVVSGDSLRTEAADPSHVADPSLIIYKAVCRTTKGFLVTNGDQTDRIQQSLANGGTFHDAVLEERHEPDAPNFTPRIAGLLDLLSPTPQAQLAVIRRSQFSEHHSEHCLFQIPELKPGFGFGVTTYEGDGKPLPAFHGAPLLLPLEAEAKDLAAKYWNSLNKQNRVSLAVMSANIVLATLSWQIYNARSRETGNPV